MGLIEFQNETLCVFVCNLGLGRRHVFTCVAFQVSATKVDLLVLNSTEAFFTNNTDVTINVMCGKKTLKNFVSSMTNVQFNCIASYECSLLLGFICILPKLCALYL